VLSLATYSLFSGWGIGSEGDARQGLASPRNAAAAPSSSSEGQPALAAAGGGYQSYTDQEAATSTPTGGMFHLP
jgi:hypothetical protein